MFAECNKAVFVICLGGDMLSNDVQCTIAQGGGGNLVASYCDDRDHVDVFGIDKISIILIFENVLFTIGSGVTLNLISPMLGHSSPISLCPSIGNISDSLMKCHAFGGDVCGGGVDGVWHFF